MSSAQSIIQMTGVTANAAKIYLALLRRGQGNYSSLATATGLHPQSVKNGLRELIEAKYVMRLDHKLTQTLWRPIPPYEIVKRLKKQYEEFSQAVPMLQGLFRQNPTTLIRVSAGVNEVLAHLGRMIDSTKSGAVIKFIGANWYRFSNDQPVGWSEIIQQAAKKRVRLSMVKMSKTMPAGPLALALTDQATLFFIFDPTESTVITIGQKRLAKQLQQLLR